MEINMKIIGITGPSGAGKSTLSTYFKMSGAHIIDADIVARNVVMLGKPALEEIKIEWPEAVSEGVLDRKVMARIAFGSEAELHKLNSITHKYIISDIKEEIEKSDSTVFVIDAIGLFESELASMCDVTIAVIANKKARISRIMARDNLTVDEAESRINAQKSDEFYTSRADYTIENNDDLTYERIEQILKEIL